MFTSDSDATRRSEYGEVDDFEFLSVDSRWRLDVTTVAFPKSDSSYTSGCLEAEIYALFKQTVVSYTGALIALVVRKAARFVP